MLASKIYRYMMKIPQPDLGIKARINPKAKRTKKSRGKRR